MRLQQEKTRSSYSTMSDTQEEFESEDNGFNFLNSVEGAMDDDNDDENDNASTDVHSIDDDDDDDQSSSQLTTTYNAKKPRWWKSLCGKPSKAQKRAMAAVMKNHELKSVPYGSFVDWDDVFSNNNNNNNSSAEETMEIWLEIGFGRGENLLANAHRKKKNNENIALVGAEISKTGVGTVCQRIEEGIASNSFWTGYNEYSPEKAKKASSEIITTDEEASQPLPLPESSNAIMPAYEPVPSGENSIIPYQNLRIYQGDGAKFLPRIPTSSLAAVLVTFPDPFPDKNQAQWRIVQVHTILEMHRILLKKNETTTTKTTGTLFLATDHAGFFEWSHKVMEKVNGTQQYFQEIDPPPERMEWLPAISRYEEKGWNEGRKTMMTFWQAVPVPSE